MSFLCFHAGIEPPPPYELVKEDFLRLICLTAIKLCVGGGGGIRITPPPTWVVPRPRGLFLRYYHSYPITIVSLFRNNPEGT